MFYRPPVVPVPPPRGVPIPSLKWRGNDPDRPDEVFYPIVFVSSLVIRGALKQRWDY